MRAYYNEHDPRTAAWLRALIQDGQIATGDVDERSIVEVTPGDLHGYTQCHFFAGIGGWSYALRLAGWADDDPVWTGSCPCQSFSASGQRKGFDDPRHLWPAWFRLLRECRPHVVFGEQVASKDGLAWLDVVSADLERAGYAVGAVDFPACGVGAPHIRQRLFFVGESDGAGSLSGRQATKTMGYRHSLISTGDLCGMADPETAVRGGADESQDDGRRPAQIGGSGFTRGFWVDAEWLACTDGKARPVEPGTFPLVDGVPARMVRLRGYGNAIVPQAAQAFIEAYRAVRIG